MGDTVRCRRKHSRWTKDEEQRLQDLWGTVRDSEVAAHIGKTTKAVREKASALGLREEKGKRAGCRPGNVTYPWTREEDLVLVKNVGHLNIFELMENLQRRSRVAIERRCYELGFSPAQGTYSRLQIEHETGYDWRQIKRARDALGQNWKRYGLRKYMITFDQAQDIIEYLKTETRKWSLQYGLDACRRCGASGENERCRHSGDGLCKRCVSGDARIMVAGRGVVRIADMVGVGSFTVWSGKGWRETEVVEAGVRETVDLVLSNGMTVAVTPDHKILTKEGMVEAGNISDDLLTLEPPSSPPFPETAQTPRRESYAGRLGDNFPSMWSRELGAFLGFVLGDGCVSKEKYPTVIIGLSEKDRGCLEGLQGIVASWCSTQSQIVDFQPKPNKICANPRPMSRIQWRSMALGMFLQDMGLHKHGAVDLRRAPSSVWSASGGGVAGFLAGLFGADGAVSVNGKGKIEVSMCTVSRGLAADVQRLLMAFGVTSKIWLYPEVQGYAQRYGVSVFGYGNVARFKEFIGFYCSRKNRALAAALERFPRNSRRTRPVTASVVATGRREPVFDLVNVGEERQFLANGISVSNCWDFRRHARKSIVSAISGGKAVLLTEDLWREAIFDGDDSTSMVV